MGPIEWEDIQLDLELTVPNQTFIFDGEAEVLGVRDRFTINLTRESALLPGPQVKEALNTIFTACLALKEDPEGNIEQLPLVFEHPGVPEPPWLDDVIDKVHGVRPTLHNRPGICTTPGHGNIMPVFGQLPLRTGGPSPQEPVG